MPLAVLRAISQFGGTVMRTRQLLPSLMCAVLLAGLFTTACSKNNRHVFGATYMTRTNPYFDVLNDAIAETVEANGDKLIVRDPLQSQEKQNRQILDMIDEGIEILFLNPVDRKTVLPALKACEKAGVKIINIDTQVDDPRYVMATIVSDNYQAGQLCARDMMKRLEKADIIIIDNPMQNSIFDRVQGFKDTISPYPQYRILHQVFGGGEIGVSADALTPLLSEPFDVVLGGNDPTALGALAALQKSGTHSDVLIYGIDGSPDFKAMIQSGYVTGTSSQSPKTIGKTAVDTAYRILRGEAVDSYVKLPCQLITKENLDRFNIDDWQ